MIKYDQRPFLFDFEFISENFDKILTIHEYIPMLIRSIFADIGYSHHLNSKEDKLYAAHRKRLYSKCYYKNMVDLFNLTEILCFIVNYPQFRAIIKDEKYLEKIIIQCEKKYNIELMDYINSYDDLNKLLKDLEGN